MGDSTNLLRTVMAEIDVAVFTSNVEDELKLVNRAGDRPREDGWKEDMKRGLSVIGERSEALSRFASAYSRLAHLPKPQLPCTSAGCKRRDAIQFGAS